MRIEATVLSEDCISIYEWDGSLHRVHYFHIEERGNFKRSYILKYLKDGTTHHVSSSYFNSLEICPERLVHRWNPYTGKPLIPHN